MKFVLFWGLSGWARILNLIQVPTRFVWQLSNLVFGEICFTLGLSGRARILNLFQVPTRFVWQLSNLVFGEICSTLGFSGRARILNLFRCQLGLFGNYRTRCFDEICFILGPSWPGTYTEFASGADYVCLGEGGGGAFWPDTLAGLGLAAITYVGRLLSFLSVEI